MPLPGPAAQMCFRTPQKNTSWSNSHLLLCRPISTLSCSYITDMWNPLHLSSTHSAVRMHSHTGAGNYYSFLWQECHYFAFKLKLMWLGDEGHQECWKDLGRADLKKRLWNKITQKENVTNNQCGIQNKQAKKKRKDLHLNYFSLEEATSSTDHWTIKTPDNRTSSVAGVGLHINNTLRSSLSGENSFPGISTQSIYLFLLKEGDLARIRRTGTTGNLLRNDQRGALTATQSSGNHSNDSLMITRKLVIITAVSTFVCDSNIQMKEGSELLWCHRFKRNTAQGLEPCCGI